MMAHIIYICALVASLAWFTMGFRYFGFQQEIAAKVLVPKSARSSPLFITIAAGLRFLGGMNAAFALLCLILLISALMGGDAFNTRTERIVILLVLATAHISQFIPNLPVLKAGERQGDSLWHVRKGPMKFIFLMDAAQTIICLGALIFQFWT